MTRSSWQPHDSFGNALMISGRRLAEFARYSLGSAELGHLSLSRLGALAALSKNPMSQIELATTLHMSAPSITELLRKLEAQGLAHGTADPNDQRRRIWNITKLGQKQRTACEETIKNVGRVIDDFFRARGLSVDDVRRLTETLQDLNRAFEERMKQ